MHQLSDSELGHHLVTVNTSKFREYPMLTHRNHLDRTDRNLDQKSGPGPWKSPGQKWATSARHVIDPIEVIFVTRTLGERRSFICSAYRYQCLTGWWFGTVFFIFPYIGNVIIPTDELIFFRGVQTTTTGSSRSNSDGTWYTKLGPTRRKLRRRLRSAQDAARAVAFAVIAGTLY